MLILLKRKNENEVQNYVSLKIISFIGSAADVCKIAMIRISSALSKTSPPAK